MLTGWQIWHRMIQTVMWLQFFINIVTAKAVLCVFSFHFSRMKNKIGNNHQHWVKNLSLSNWDSLVKCRLNFINSLQFSPGGWMNNNEHIVISDSTSTIHYATPENWTHIAAWNYSSSWLAVAVLWEPQEPARRVRHELRQPLPEHALSSSCHHRAQAGTEGEMAPGSVSHH